MGRPGVISEWLQHHLSYHSLPASQLATLPPFLVVPSRSVTCLCIKDIRVDESDVHLK